MTTTIGLLAGKVGLVVGVANEQSIAAGCAKAFRAAGAEFMSRILDVTTIHFNNQVRSGIVCPSRPATSWLEPQKEMIMSRLTNKIAVVTGGNSGIGLATAHEFVRESAKVVIFGRNKASLANAQETLGPNAIAVQGDVTSRDLDRLFATVKAKHGRVDILYVNAGVAEFRPVEAADDAHYDRLFDINVKGAYRKVQAALPVRAPGLARSLSGLTGVVAMPCRLAQFRPEAAVCAPMAGGSGDRAVARSGWKSRSTRR